MDYTFPQFNNTNINGPVGIREAIKLELKKETIRAEILAEEIQRRRVLQPEMVQYDQLYSSDLLQDAFHWARQRLSSEFIAVGKSSGSKRKAPAPPTKDDFSCAVCQISAPCARGLQEHISGKKHLTKVAATKADNKKIMKQSLKGPMSR